MLKDNVLNNIKNAFKKVSSNRKISIIYENDDTYVLFTEPLKDGAMNTDPYYFCDKGSGNIVPSSVLRFPEFKKILNEAKQNLVWEE